jgi:hypothetical protein
VTQRQLWVIKIAVLASEDEVEQLSEALVNTICPDPDHDGDCATPWALTTLDGTSLPPRQQAALHESIRLTNPDPAQFL